MTKPEYYKTIQGWFNFQDLYSSIVDNLEEGVIVEVGCWLGSSTSYMGELIKYSKKDIKFYAVDTWKGSPSEKIHSHIISQHNDDIFTVFKNNMKEAGLEEIVNPIRKLSVEGSKDFSDKSLDFVYIDAGHTYEEVMDDLIHWTPKVKDGGSIGGHDYYQHSGGNKDMEGVKKAVDEFFLTKDVQIIDNSWLTKI